MPLEGIQMSRQARLVLAPGAISVIAVAGLTWAYFGPLGLPKPFKQADFDGVVAQIRSGVLKPDRQGVVVLPQDRAALTATGRVYVSRGAKGGLLVLFPAWVGRNELLISPLDLSGDSWLEAYIYDSRPDDGGPLLGPPAEPYWRAVHDKRAVEWNLWTAHQISEHWQYAYPFS
jgi:hypothetical protein